MYWYHANYFGMHFFWWMFWIVLILAVFLVATPVPRRRMRLYRENPLAIL